MGEVGPLQFRFSRLLPSRARAIAYLGGGGGSGETLLWRADRGRPFAPQVSGL